VKYFFNKTTDEPELHSLRDQQVLGGIRMLELGFACDVPGQ